MADFEKDILNRLIDKYQNSVLSKGGSNKNIKISLTLKDKELKTYNAVDSYNYRNKNDAVLRELEQKKFIHIVWDSEGDFKSLSLNTDNVSALYKYLKRVNPSNELNNIKHILENSNATGFIKDFVQSNLNNIREKYSWHKNYFSSSNELKSILKALNNLVNLNKETKIRDFSIQTFGDSKFFDTIKNKVAKIIKDYDMMCGFEDTDEILTSYNIIKNSTYALVKNNMVFKLNDEEIDLDKLGFEFCLSDEMIQRMEIKKISSENVITVENLTSFYKLDDKKSVIVYLGGFHNHTKKELLKKIYNAYPQLNYYHFGDIDAGGFLIYNNLIESTKIPFEPYRMGLDEIDRNNNFAKKLTENDIGKLKKMQTDDKFKKFHDVIDYMLKRNMKLEQEILDEQ